MLQKDGEKFGNLEKEISQIKDKLRSYDSSLSELFNLKEELDKKKSLIIEIGKFDSDEQWDDTKKSEEGYFKHQAYCYHFNFKNKFNSIPKIFLSISGLYCIEDTVYIHAENINEAGFDLVIESSDYDWNENLDVAIVVEWLAIQPQI